MKPPFLNSRPSQAPMPVGCRPRLGRQAAAWGLGLALLAPPPGKASQVADHSAVPHPGDAPSALILLIRGAEGRPEYGQRFDEQIARWRAVAEKAGAACDVLGVDPVPPGEKPADREQLRERLAREQGVPTPPLWLVFIGHGSFDGHHARFNLRGPDFTEAELADWLRPFRRPLVLIHAFSASGPFLPALSASNRVILTATRSGDEVNYARLGEYLAPALDAPAADLDQDGQVSLLEAFLFASARVREFYETEGRLVTEHALVDDNGDGLGTPAEWFRGVRATRKPEQGRALDGLRARQILLLSSPAERRLTAEQRARRDRLEQELFELRERKATLEEETYWNQLESLLLRLASLYRESNATGAEKAEPHPLPAAPPATAPVPFNTTNTASAAAGTLPDPPAKEP